MTLAALSATLQLYRNADEAEQSVPILQMLSTPIENLKLRAEKAAAQLGSSSKLKDITIVEDHSMLGGGSLPTQRIPTGFYLLPFSIGSWNRWSKLAGRV